MGNIHKSFPITSPFTSGRLRKQIAIENVMNKKAAKNKLAYDIDLLPISVQVKCMQQRAVHDEYAKP